MTSQEWEDYGQGDTPEQFTEHKWKNEALQDREEALPSMKAEEQNNYKTSTW